MHISKKTCFKKPSHSNASCKPCNTGFVWVVSKAYNNNICIYWSAATEKDYEVGLLGHLLIDSETAQYTPKPPVPISNLFVFWLFVVLAACCLLPSLPCPRIPNTAILLILLSSSVNKLSRLCFLRHEPPHAHSKLYSLCTAEEI